MSVIKEAEAHVGQLYKDESDSLLFHNWKFKQLTIAKTEALLKESSLNALEKDKVLLAAWFLHTGYLKSYENPNEHSLNFAREFLESHKTEKAMTDHVLGALSKADGAPEYLESELQKVVYDIAHHFLADENFDLKIELLKSEIRAHRVEGLSNKAWRKHMIQQLRNEPVYLTDYAKQHWQEQREKNLNKLLKNKKKTKKLEQKEALKAKFKNQMPDRGIQTLYRVTLRNHIKLSDIADTKANILLSVNAIIISLALANLIPKLDNPSNGYLIYPTFIFIIFCITSMIMSIMATRPNITSGEFTKEDVRAKKVNLLFFGNFHKMKLESYEWAMMRLIEDRDYIYTSLTKDLYYLGIVLERKYRLLRWTYTVFMIGMILSVIAFGIALKFFGPDRVLKAAELVSQ